MFFKWKKLPMWNKFKKIYKKLNKATVKFHTFPSECFLFSCLMCETFLIWRFFILNLKKCIYKEKNYVKFILEIKNKTTTMRVFDLWMHRSRLWTRVVQSSARGSNSFLLLFIVSKLLPLVEVLIVLHDLILHPALLRWMQVFPVCFVDLVSFSFAH